MSKFIIISTLFHLAFLIAFKLDFVGIKKNKDQIINIRVLEEVKSSEPKKKIIKKPEKKEIKKPEKKKVKKPEKKKVKKPEKKKVKKLEKKQIKQTNKPKQENKFDDLLKDLAKKELLNKPKKNIDKTIQKLSQNELLNDTVELQKGELSEIEKIILNQVDRNWSRPPGIKIEKNLIIKIIIFLDITGEVINIKIHSDTKNALKKNNKLQLYLDTAIRAVKKSSPIEGLRKDRYNIWKEIIINFKPIEMRL